MLPEETPVQIVDSHAHLADAKFSPDLPRVVARAHEAHVEAIVAVGDSVESSRRSVEIAHRFGKVYATVGVHPHAASGWSEEAEAQVRAMAGDRRVVAIGETGLDYHHTHAPRPAQMAAFRAQLRLAKELRLPVVIHCRQAAADVLRAIEAEHSGHLRGVVHCFAEDLDTARRLLDLGFHLGVGGLITFKNTEPLREVFAAVGLDRVLVETDAPYLAPAPKRGRRNEPSYLRLTVKALADVTGHNALDAARITRHNAIALFRLPLREASAVAYALGDRLCINLTNRCTNACQWCHRGEEWFAAGHNLRLEEEPDADAVMRAVDAHALSRFREVVVSGFGEPTLRLDVLLEVARRLKAKGCRTRLITNGQGDLINGGPILPRLAEVFDALTVTLNAPCADAYVQLARPQRGREAFEAVLRFLEEAPRHIGEVTLSAIEDERVDAEGVRRQVAERLGLPLVLTPSHPLA